jgi:tetratricopeptide (TPR) repeat protein
MRAIGELAASDWHRLNRLLEAALALDDDARAPWLAAAAGTDADLLPLLRQLLDEGAGIETDAFAGRPPMSAEAPAAEQPGEAFGPYRLQHVLGEGGMGTVWLAERADGAFERAVALKLPRAEWTDRGLAQRFARERAVLASLNHPNIAQMFDAGWSASGRPYLALEYIEGVPITEWCDGRRLGVAARLELFVDVIRAVAYAHSRLVVHRDLKPSNVLVTEAGEVKLLDFGIAKLLADDGSAAAETELTRIGGRALTLQYAAPEQILGQPVTTAADVYALGVLLFELLSGERPYRLSHEDLQRRGALEDAVLHADAPAPSSVATDPTARRSLRGDPDAIVLRALHKSPERRYETAAAFADDIERHLAKLPVRARRAGLLYRISRYVARHRLAVGAISAVIVALTAGLSAALWQARVARDEAARATLIKDFVLSIIQQADPVASRQTREADVALLVTAQGRVDQELAQQPELALQMRRAIGAAYRNRGDFQRARAVLREGIEQARPMLPARHAELLAAHVQMAEEMLIDHPRAVQDLEATITVLRAQGAGALPTLSDALVARHRILRWRGTWKVGRDSAHEALEMARSTGDPGRVLAAASDVVESLHHLAGYTGESLKIISAAREQAALSGRVEASDPRAIVAVAAHGLALCHAGRDAEAPTMAMEAVATARRHHGNEAHVTELVLALQGDTLRCLNDATAALEPLREAHAISARRDDLQATNRDLRRTFLLQAMLAVGKRDEARRLLEETPMRRATPDVPSNWPTATPAHMQTFESWVRHALGQSDLAEQLAEATVPLLKSENVPHLTGRLYQVLTEILHYGGKSARAEPYALGCVAEIEQGRTDFQPTPRARGNALLALADVRRALGKHELALADADRALAAFAEDGAPGDRDRASVDSVRGRALLGLGRHREALQALSSAHRHLQDRPFANLALARRAWWHGRALVANGESERGRALMDTMRPTLAASRFGQDRQLVADADQR